MKLTAVPHDRTREPIPPQAGFEKWRHDRRRAERIATCVLGILATVAGAALMPLLF